MVPEFSQSHVEGVNPKGLEGETANEQIKLKIWLHNYFLFFSRNLKIIEMQMTRFMNWMVKNCVMKGNFKN